MTVSNDTNQAKKFTRRAFVIGGLQITGLTILGSRLAWIQLTQGKQYKMLSEKNRINIKIIPPSRGLIYDRFGLQLAVNKQSFRLFAIPEQTDDLSLSLRKVQNLIDLEEDDIQNTLSRAQKTPKFIPIEIKNNLTWKDVTTIEVNMAKLPGLHVETGELRSYNFAESTAHITGYVGLPNKNDLAGGDPVLSLPGFRLGKTGIEKSYDKTLRGKAGKSDVEVNVVGREIREVSRTPAHRGAAVTLSIDMTLQAFMHQRLRTEKSAAAVVMNAHSGAVYGLVSHPGYDPNLFTHGLSAKTWEELLANPGKPLNNKITTGLYPPASTFKMITALAGMETGHITRHTTTHCRGHYEYGKDRFHCWKLSGHGKLNVVSALSQSCDILFYKLATEIGINKIAETARKMGLGSKLGFDLGTEKPGLVPDQSWKRGYFGKSWKPGETIVASIGQGYLQATPLQLATMTARLINGGHAVKPWITGYIGNAPVFKKQWPLIDLNPTHLSLIKQGMDDTVNHAKGTAIKSRIEKQHWAMGGKTGTAQVKKINRAQRMAGLTNEDLPWKFRHHALFVGYAPIHDPQYVCCVVVEHGVGGSISAAPIAKDIMLQVQKRNLANTAIQPGGI